MIYIQKNKIVKLITDIGFIFKNKELKEPTYTYIPKYNIYYFCQGIDTIKIHTTNSQIKRIYFYKNTHYITNFIVYKSKYDEIIKYMKENYKSEFRKYKVKSLLK